MRYVPRVTVKQYYSLSKLFQRQLASSASGGAFSRPRTLSRYTAAYNMIRGPEVFRISDYDCFGFDLDNTLVQYKIANMIQMEYDALAAFLTREKGYPSEVLQRPMFVDFMQKGMILDFERGNVIKLSPEGVIRKASHGTRIMDDAEVERIYGKERRWDITDAYVENMLIAWNGPLSERIRTLLDYFDMPAGLLFARIVDYLDEKGPPPEKYNVWPDILDGLRFIYDREHFASGKGGYFSAMKADPGKFVHRASPKLLGWLRMLREHNKSVFLITGSHIDFATLTASHALGDDWRSLFDLVVCFAKKPGFFTESRPFIELNGTEERDQISPSQLQLNEIYSHGNWRDLLPLMAKHSGKNNAKFLYFGDNIIQDVYTPGRYTKCDTVAVVEEMLSEGIKGYDELHQDCSMLNSHMWGSFFSNGEEPSIWSAVLRRYAKLCVPTIETLAKYPIDYEFHAFSEDDEFSRGWYPNDPLHAK